MNLAIQDAQALATAVAPLLGRSNCDEDLAVALRQYQRARWRTNARALNRAGFLAWFTRSELRHRTFFLAIELLSVLGRRIWNRFGG